MAASLTALYIRRLYTVPTRVLAGTAASLHNELVPSDGRRASAVLFFLSKADCHSWPLKGNPRFEREKREKEERDSQKEKIKDFDFTYEKLALAEIRNNSAEVDIAPIYRKRKLAHEHLPGVLPKPRYLWKEYAETTKKEGFPESPDEANSELYAYLVQKDAFRRRQTFQIPEFCVGSTVAVTRADPYAPKGQIRFVGICISKSVMDNHPGSTFLLRNVIDGEPVEIRFHTYSPLLQKVEVLKHETRGKHDLKHLRDLPPEESYVREDTEAEPYTAEPKQFQGKPGVKKKRSTWFKQFFLRRNRKHRDKRIQKDDGYPYKKNKTQFLS